MPNDQPRTHLPEGIPQSIRDFIRTPGTTEMDIEAGDLDWLPKPETGNIPVPDVTPELTFEDGPTPGTVEISVGWGFLKITLTGSIEDGKLSVTPPAFPGLGQEVTDWVDDFNADLDASGMQLSDLSITNGKLHLEKEEVPAVVEETSSATADPPVAVTPAPRPAATTPPVAPVPTPAKGSKTEAFLSEHGKKAAAAGVLAIAAAAFFLFVDDEPAMPRHLLVRRRLHRTTPGAQEARIRTQAAIVNLAPMLTLAPQQIPLVKRLLTVIPVRVTLPTTHRRSLVRTRRRRIRSVHSTIRGSKTSPAQ